MADLDLETIAVLVLMFFLVWYYAASVYSRRLAARVARELRGPVLGLGGTSQVRWFGTTAFRMTINWAIGRAQGRRDAALVEAALRKDPKLEFELADPRTRIGQRRRRARSDWSTVALDGRELLLAADDQSRVVGLLEAVGPANLRPIMALHLTMGRAPGIAASVSVGARDAVQAIATIRTLADRVSA
ncbi:MAG: hypothetical protein E6K04_01600 [Methanobacteriota archaeon]|nr:MAG: hypothetical protein E6K04_01600 [Euryarchaeota archaeon]